jgi:hypothetical protein
MYDKLELKVPAPLHPWQNNIPIFAHARTFLWQHWHDEKRGHLTVTLSSVDHTGTSHIFAEPDYSGRWRVYWRVLDRRELIDEPTAYWALWVVPGRDKPQLRSPQVLRLIHSSTNSSFETCVERRFASCKDSFRCSLLIALRQYLSSRLQKFCPN